MDDFVPLEDSWHCWEMFLIVTTVECSWPIRGGPRDTAEPLLVSLCWDQRRKEELSSIQC